MILGIDVGGTKTLVAALDKHGVIKEKIKFPTPDNYDDFGPLLKQALSDLETKDFAAAGVGIPGNVNRKHGIGIRFGNLDWKNVPIQQDVEKVAKCPAIIENDAKLAGLSEAMLLKNSYKKVMYLTVSTGIGYALVVNGVLDTNISDAGGHGMKFEYHGKFTEWEDFASGRAIVELYGKRAEDIHDEATWTKICKNISVGLIELIMVLEPEVIVIGGSVGTYFDRYGKILEKVLDEYKLPITKYPKLVGAKRAEEAVIYGCYDIAKQTYPHATDN